MKMTRMNTVLARRLSIWFLAVVSIAAAVMGATIATGQLSALNTTLTDGSATAADVYVGQSMVIVGAVLLGVGILGGMLTVAVSVLQPSQAQYLASPPEAAKETAPTTDSVVPVDVAPADETPASAAPAGETPSGETPGSESTAEEPADTETELAEPRSIPVA